MALTKSDCVKTVFQFKFDTDKLNSAEVKSPEITLCQVNWIIKLIKRETGGYVIPRHVLDIVLVAVKATADETIGAWSCEARAVFRLMASDAERDVVKIISKKEYSNECSSHQIKDFICWNELTCLENEYVKQNAAVLEVQISANPLKRQKSMDLEITSTDRRVVVKNVSKLGSSFSPEDIVGGIRWKVQTKRADEHLGVFLWAEKNDLEMDWSWEVDYSFKLLSFCDTIEPETIECSSVFKWGMESCGCSKFMKWSEFVDPKKYFIRNDVAIFTAEIAVKPPKPQWECEKTAPKVGSAFECSICLEKFRGREVSSTKCGHMFCSPCINRSITDRQKCPLCNAEAKVVDLRPLFFT